MPTYEYKCRSCGTGFELRQAISEEPVRTCPSCGKDEVRRVINGGMGIIFKGSGFYKNDSRKPESTSAKSDSAASASASASAPCESCASAPACDTAGKAAV